MLDRTLLAVSLIFVAAVAAGFVMPAWASS